MLVLIQACDKPSGNGGQEQKEALFRLVSAEQSGIDFQNTVQHDVSTMANLFDFDYFYNGAGVAIVDINNDGLQDIFFCGNQVPNRLYLNKGGLVFDDVSDVAGINKGKKWSNGVSIVDLNEDGWSDIYVSQGGPNPESDRKNLLYINQQDNTFEELAEEYGLADPGLSTQSAFFDYDKDGDLDCFVTNESTAYGLDPVSFYRKMNEERELILKSSSHLYQNNDGVFTDVTAQAGMLRPSFGLGLSVSDINGDGWLDIYIANDYYIPDAMYINQGNGRFFDEIKLRASQVSFFGMGVDIADFNNDLYQDILVLDMASKDHYRSKTLMASMDVEQFDLLTDKLNFAHQYMFNSLQLNNTNHNFTNVSHQLGIAKTDWSWAGLVADFDNDGWKDIYVTNGYRRYALDNDFKNEVVKTKVMYRGNVPMDAKRELYESMNSERISNVLYKNNGSLDFTDISKTSGIGVPSFSNGAAYGDLDNDGDLDLVVNNLDHEAFLFANNSQENRGGNFLTVVPIGKLSEGFPKVYLRYGDSTQMIETKGVRGYFSYNEPIAHFGLGQTKQVDTVRVEWPDGNVNLLYNLKANQRITVSQETVQDSEEKSESSLSPLFTEAKDLGLDYHHVENEFDDFRKEVLLPYKQSTIGPAVATGDVNGDGLQDIFLGGGSGQRATIFVRTDNGFMEVESPDFQELEMTEDVGAIFFDLEGDGDQDLYVVSGGNEFEPESELYQDKVFENNGKGVFTRVEAIENPVRFSGGAIAKLDFDNDGDEDLIVGNRIIPQHYPTPAESRILQNNNGKLVDVTALVSPEFMEFGIVNDLLVTDLDQDGQDDFIAVGEWTGIGLFYNRNGKFENRASDSGIDKSRGWWYSASQTDVNQDEYPDYVIGNVGLNTKFKASSDKPFKVYADDFDANGTLDVVLSQPYKDEYVPVRGRECSSEQMPFIAKKFDTYSSFANASMEEIFGDKLENSLALEVNQFESVVLIGNAEGNFDIKLLPAIAQSFPLLSAVSRDVDNDGLQDLILAGNIYNTEVETPRWDGGKGIILRSLGNGQYRPLTVEESGIYVSGNVKSLKWVTTQGDKDLLLAIRNNGPLSVFQFNL